MSRRTPRVCWAPVGRLGLLVILTLLTGTGQLARAAAQERTEGAPSEPGRLPRGARAADVAHGRQPQLSSMESSRTATWMVGLPVAQVSLEAPAGGLPRENLEPLLRLHQGDPYSPALVRQDIGLLIRAGDFASVEVDAEPWFTMSEQGEPLSAVRVTYRVHPPPRLDRIELSGVGGKTRRLVLSALGLGRGEAFFPRRDAAAARERVRSALVAEGWPQAQLDVAADRDADGQILLGLRVDLGRPRVLEGVVVAASLSFDEERIRAELRRSGLKRSRRITGSSAHDAREAIRRLLVRQGYLDPRLTLLFSEAKDGMETLAVLGEPGPRTEIVATGKGAPTRARVAAITRLQVGMRLTEGSAADSAAAVEGWLQRRGWYAASVTPRIERAGGDALLVLAVQRGVRHRLSQIEVVGADDLGRDLVDAALRSAAPVSLGRSVLVDADLDLAMRSLRELYRGRGYLSAQAQVGVPVTGAARWRWPWHKVVPVTLPVTVDEGPQTQLSSLTIEGASLGTAVRVSEAREELVGEAYRPGELETLRRELVARFRSDGYLGAAVKADVNVYQEQGPEGETMSLADARLQALAGDQTRLRSVIIQGNTHTRRSLIARELALEVGQPITPDDIEETRHRLYDLDLFRVVTLDLVGEDDRAKDLIVRVEEQAPVLFELGGGIATDRGVTARGRVAMRNLGGRGHRVSVLTQAGYAWQGDAWSLDTLTPVWRAALRYEAPNVPARGQRLVAEAVINETIQEPTFRTAESGGSLGLRLKLGGAIRAFLSYDAKLRTLEDVDPGALVSGDPWLSVMGLSDPPIAELDLRAVRRVVTGPVLTAVVDRRDDPLDAREGLRLATKLQLYDGALTHQVSLRGEGRVDLLAPLGSLILALGGTAGAGWVAGADTTLPVEDRFYLGGSGSLRGFRPSSVGPARRVPRGDYSLPDAIDPLVRNTTLASEPTHWVMTGGDAVVAGTIELRVPFSSLGIGDLDDAWLVGFADVGRVAFLTTGPQPTSQVEGLDPMVRVGTGGGIRLATAIGPISLLVGLNPLPMSGRDEAPVLLHFTLGDL